jgi:hypothetical protein
MACQKHMACGTWLTLYRIRARSTPRSSSRRCWAESIGGKIGMGRCECGGGSSIVVHAIQ